MVIPAPTLALVAGAVTLAAPLLHPPGAAATFPGSNGQITYAHVTAGIGGDPEIAVIDPDGQNFAELTSNSLENYDPAYSADGERIAFIQEPEVPPGAAGQVWVMNADGTGPTQLTAGGGEAADLSPAFSPDGQKVAFDRYNGMVTTQVWIMNADGSGQTPLTTEPQSSRSPAYSPDGNTIAFQRDAPGALYEIWSMDADGSNQRRLTTSSPSVGDSSPSFTPDGRIVFTRSDGSDDDIWTMNPDGTDQAPVTDTPGVNERNPVFSPDGKRIAYEYSGPGPDGLRVMDADGQNDGPLNPSARAGDQFPDWQPLNPPGCALSGKKQKSVKRVSITVTCGNEDAAMSAHGAGKAPRAKSLAIASKAKRFRIPEVTGEIPAGAPTRVTLAVPKKGRKALKKATQAGKRGKATINATFTDDLGQSASDSLRVRFKPKK